MGTIIREMVMQADDERNYDLIRLVKDILDEFAFTVNCPSDWSCIGESTQRIPESTRTWNYAIL